MKIAIEANTLTNPNTGVAKSLINLMEHIKGVEFILFIEENRTLQCEPKFPFTLITYKNAYGGGCMRF